MVKTKYTHLFSPIKINQMMVPNRIIAAPANGGYSKERATSGAGINIWGCGKVNLENAGMMVGHEYMFTKYQYQNTRKILDFMSQGGSKASLEIMHAGMMARGNDNVGPVATVNKDGYKCRALTEKEMIEIAEAFGKTCKDAKDFGFDMVMLHFAHGWLPAEFLSPAWNKRTDRYGGSYENRARFPLMILKAVRKAVGNDYPVDMRISAKEWVDDEIEFEDVLHFIQDAEPYIDMVNISAGTDMDKEGCVHMTTTALEERLTNIEYSKKVKERVKIPVAVVGSIFTPDEADTIIKDGYADLVMIGRALIADPFWIRKAYKNQSDEIVPCIRCGYCSHWASNRYNHGCSVNPHYLRESWINYLIPQNPHPRKFLIVGGGPAGMRAAITAYDRGEKVILLEKNDVLGGALSFTDFDNHKKDLKRYKDYLIRQVNERNIDVRLNFCANRDNIKELEPDVLIIAIGAEKMIPNIKGVEKCISFDEAYRDIDAVGKRVIIIGGGTIGCELALELNAKHKVTIIESQDKLHRQDSVMLDIALDQHLSKAENINIMKKAECIEITDHEVLLKDGSALAYDTVILAVGLKARLDEANTFYGITEKTFIIGDCKRSAKIKEANDAAYFTALNV